MGNNDGKYHKSRIKMVLRPHQIGLSANDSTQGFEDSIISATYLGNQIQYMVDSELGPLFVITEPSVNSFVVGDNFVINFCN